MTPPVNNPGSDNAGDSTRPPLAASANARVQAALKEYLERIDHGDTVDREEFLSQRPEIANELRSFIDAEDELRKLGQLNERGSTSTQSFALHGQETLAPQGGARRSEGGSGLKQTFGRYRIIKALGKGAMGMVYLAEDTQLMREVALKTPHFEQEPTPELLERFYREARAAANLRHPNICPVHDVGQIEGTHYISMAFIDGHPLSAFIRTKPQPERQILIVVRKLAQALGEAHERGIVHRDLKPANIMVDKRNEPIIMDFGLARKLEHAESVRITQSGMLIGTPAYMSPEQIEGEPDKVGPASDQFSLGVILYELLTGQLPFRGSLSAVMAQILTKNPPSPSQLRPDLDPRIEALCLKMLAKVPADRFPSLAAVAEEIARILRNPAGKPSGAAEGGKSTVGFPPNDPPPIASALQQTQPKKSIAEQAPLTSLAAKDLASLDELAQKCLARRDYEQVIQIVERIPANKRTPALTAALKTASDKVDEITFLICDIDEAVRFKDRARALKKADELLALKPGHHHALEVQQQFAEGGSGGVRLIKQFAQPWQEGGWIPWSVLAFGLAVCGLVYGIIVINLGTTAVVVEVTDPGVSVEVKDAGKQIEIVTGPRESKIEVVPGEQQLKVTYAGLETKTQRFEIKKGFERRVTVSLVNGSLVAQLDKQSLPLISPADKIAPTQLPPIKQPPQTADAGKQRAPEKPTSPPVPPRPPAVLDRSPPPGFVSLFNGIDLTGWQRDPVEPGGWHVENGELTGGGPSKPSGLYSDRTDYQDFHLHIEARLTGDESGAVCIRTQIPPTNASSRLPMSGYEIILREPDDPKEPRTGTVYGLTDPQTGELREIGFRRFDKMIEPGEWFTIDIFAQANRTIVRINGKEALNNPWKRKQYPPGRIALVQDLGMPSARYRKIEISDLKTGAELPVDKAVDKTLEKPPEKSIDVTPGYVALFNGRNLSGWKTHESQPGGWRFEDGMIVGDGPSRSHLYSERGNYRDFHLRVEAKINAGGNSGVFGRATYGVRWPLKDPQFPLGYEAQIYDVPGRTRTGCLYITDRGPVVPVSEFLVPASTLFTIELLVEGDHITVKVNGKTTADYHDPKPIAPGHIALQLHDPSTVVSFRKIEIRELGQSVSAANAAPQTASPAVLAAPFDESAANSLTQLWAERLKSPVEATNSIGMHLRLVPPGEFRMGGDHKSDEQPEHDVAITRPFYVGTYEVTKGEFTKFASSTNYKTRAETAGGAWCIEDVPKTRKWYSSRKHTFHDVGFSQDLSHPAVVICWDDAQAFCSWLSQKEARHYRLPTEAEWEYFCRAGTTTAAYNGDPELGLTTIGNVADVTAGRKFPAWATISGNDGFLYTSPVGKFRPNNFGLFDTIGNAKEWCSDWYAVDYYAHSPKDDPSGPPSGTKRVVRGGSFTSVPSASHRSCFTPDNRAFDCGFRVVCEIPLDAPQPAFGPTTTAAPPSRPSRHVWKGPHSTFVNRSGRLWRETIAQGGQIHNFVEVRRTADYIELLDRGRAKGGVRIRLQDDQALMIWGGKDKDWRQLQTGQWEAATP